jgi:hypothetical protein
VVILSLGLGVYLLSMAASLDQWLTDRIYYRVGVDLTFEPYREMADGTVRNRSSQLHHSVLVSLRLYRGELRWVIGDKLTIVPLYPVALPEPAG